MVITLCVINGSRSFLLRIATLPTLDIDPVQAMNGAHGTSYASRYLAVSWKLTFTIMLFRQRIAYVLSYMDVL